MVRKLRAALKAIDLGKKTIIGSEQGMRVAGRRIAAVAAELPGIRQARQWRYQSRFHAGCYHCGYSGVYDTLEAAAHALPSGLAGFDHPEMADIDHYTTTEGGFEPMPATEYPVLFWLDRALREGARSLLDIGGYVGHVFHQYDDYLDFPDDFRWTVFDLPQITEAGRSLTAHDGPPRLRFTNVIDPNEEVDVMFAAGSLQLLGDTYLHDCLKARSRLPRHLIVQRTPLHEKRAFATIQSVITRGRVVAFCPYMVAHRRSFITGLTGLGYRLVDSWEKERSLDVPFHPECHVETYSGLYFRLGEG